MLYVLLYDYVSDAAQRRVPFRQQHLDLLKGLHQRGQVVLAGAWNDPLDGAAIVFKDRKAAEDFIKADPYVANALVTRWRVREWNVVIGA